MPDKALDDQRAAELVIVPDVVGERFLAAREIAQSAGLTLANPDADGPPISEIAWPNNPIIERQSPPPGSVLYRNDSLRVWLRVDLEPDMARKDDSPPPSADRAHATPDKPVQRVELSSDDTGDEPVR
jgi:PASTA domain-containing protein